MSKTTKPERRAIAALEDAAAAAKFAKQVAKTLPGKQAKKLRAAADEAKSATDVSKKTIRQRPKKVAKRAEKAADSALAATESALSREQKKAAAKAEKAAAKVTKGARKKDAAKTDASPQASRGGAAKKRGRDESIELADLVAPTELVAAVVEVEPAEPEPGEPEPPQPEPTHESPESGSAFGPAADEHSLEPAETAPPTDLDTLTVAALRERARDEGRTGFSRLTKAQLVELLS